MTSRELSQVLVERCERIGKKLHGAQDDRQRRREGSPMDDHSANQSALDFGVDKYPLAKMRHQVTPLGEVKYRTSRRQTYLQNSLKAYFENAIMRDCSGEAIRNSAGRLDRL
jgi:hypothetical protein